MGVGPVHPPHEMWEFLKWREGPFGDVLVPLVGVDGSLSAEGRDH